MSAIEFVRTRYALSLKYIVANPPLFVVAVLATSVPGILADRWLSAVPLVLTCAVLTVMEACIALVITASALGTEYRQLSLGDYLAAVLLTVLTWVVVTLGMIIFIIPGIIVGLLFSVALPALVVQYSGAESAMNSSWRLVRPKLARVALLWLPVAMTGATVIGLALLERQILPAQPIVLNLVCSLLTCASAVLAAFAYDGLRDVDP
ncbi:MAG: hypothetical protein V4537_03190 [Pseudomonadota bacterium]